MIALPPIKELTLEELNRLLVLINRRMAELEKKAEQNAKG